MPVISVRNQDGSFSDVLTRSGGGLAGLFSDIFGGVANVVTGGLIGGGGGGGGGNSAPTPQGGDSNALLQLTFDGLSKVLGTIIPKAPAILQPFVGELPGSSTPAGQATQPGTPRMIDLWRQLNWWRAYEENGEDRAAGQPLRHPGLPVSWDQLQVGAIPAGITEAAMVAAIQEWKRRVDRLGLPTAGVGGRSSAGLGGAGPIVLIGGLALVGVLMMGRRRK